VYTPLKPVTHYNTWVGAVVGAVPPLMGWTAAGGELLSPEAALLSGALFLWQIPHFLALAWMYRADYAAGGYEMLPRRDPTGERTAAVCLEYSCYLTALPFAVWASGLTGCMFAVESLAFNGVMLAAAARFVLAPPNARVQQAQYARRLFFASLGYLPLFFGCLLLHQQSNRHAATEDEEVAAPEAARARLREAGRQYCLHEQLEAPSLCPKGAADEVAAVAHEVAARAAAGLAGSRQTQPPS